MKSTIEDVLNSLKTEESSLTHRLGLVRDGIQALQNLLPLYSNDNIAPSAVVTNVEAQPAPTVVAHQEQVETKPRATVVSAEVALPYVADAAPVEAAVAEATPAAPTVVEPVTPVLVKTTQPGDLGNGDTVEKLTHDVNAWRPVLPREKLEDIYRMLLLRRDRFTRELPPTMDLSNPQVIRTLINHLRHEAVPGYYQLCSRLKQHTHLSYLYRCARDRATGAIFRAYPELSCQANEDAALQPSGVHQFGALKGLGKSTGDEVQAAAA